MKNISIKNNEELLKGFLAVCDAVSETLGAEGKYAILEATDPYSPPIITKDGISVARQIFFPEKFNNIGAFLAKQVATKTLVKSGDSTTTSLVLAKNFITKSNGTFNKAVERGIQAGYEEVLEKLNSYSQQVTPQTLKSIATISANNDEKIGQIIIDAYDSVGLDGLIEVREDTDSPNTVLEVSKGMIVNAGYASPWLINNQSNATWVNADVLVVCVEAYGIDEELDIFLTENKSKPILLIMERFDENLLSKLEGLVVKGILNLCLLQAPDFDKKRRALLEDVALYTDGEVYIKGTSDKVICGKADRVVVYEGRTEIIKKEIGEKVTNRISELKQQLESIQDKDFIKRRIQKLEGKSCTIKVGGVTQSESKERFDRVEDAVSAVKSAKEEGWVAGGGSALVYISGQMQQTFENVDEQKGYNLVKEVIKAPFKQIISNANREENQESYLVSALETYGAGYNAKTDKVSNLIEDGVLDSTKSIRVALDNAKSVAVQLLNVGVIVTYSN